MNLYELRPIENSEGEPWEPWYDKCFGVVVRAESELKARELASGHHGDEGKDVWLDERFTTCKILSNEGIEEVIIKDFASA